MKIKFLLHPMSNIDKWNNLITIMCDSAGRTANSAKYVVKVDRENISRQLSLSELVSKYLPKVKEKLNTLVAKKDVK